MTTIDNTPFEIHGHDPYGYYTGNSRMTTPLEGTPYRWTNIELPEIPEGKFAMLNGDSWVIVDSYPVIPAPVPEFVTQRQARLALFNAGKLDLVEAAIDSLPEPDRSIARVEWTYAATINRRSPLVAKLIVAINLSESETDDLFITAATL